MGAEVVLNRWGDCVLYGLASLYSFPVLPLDSELKFNPENDEQFFAAIPQRPGVYLIETRAASAGSPAKPYLARTADLRRAAERLLRPPDGTSKRLNLRAVAGEFRFRVIGSRFEQSLALYLQAHEHFPAKYRGFLRLRPAALLKVNLRNSYPRCYVTRRILSDDGYYFGPFASRQQAESFANQFLDLFKIRRCQIKIRRDPAFPGCIYSEMKMCLAPCFAGCTKEEYDREVSRVVQTLESAGASLSGEIEREREAASEAMDFERAAALHKKIEKVTGVLRGLPDLARRVDNLHAVVIQRGSAENSVVIFGVVRGKIAEPLFLSFDQQASNPRSVEEVLRRHFGALSADERPENGATPMTKEEATEREDHLALLARWYYSNPRDGEILFRDDDWPYRRILRACARVLAAGNPA
ncbi:MAG TPA: UvrB/UvrC motif-containing protein [Candidatus Acidoferrales bacterium]|nr:UvrB/UvrC motif-containing protein [Candidatus Acidoferrales bacterium]